MLKWEGVSVMWIVSLHVNVAWELVKPIISVALPGNKVATYVLVTAQIAKKMNACLSMQSMVPRDRNCPIRSRTINEMDTKDFVCSYGCKNFQMQPHGCSREYSHS